MTGQLAAITISIPPTFEVGPVTLAWHGIMTAAGIVAGAWLAMRYARERHLNTERLLNAVLIIAVAGFVGARFYFLAENDPGALLRPSDWLGNTGFAFYGAMILGIPAVGIYIWRSGLKVRYLDALAAGFPLGMAIGRLGDVINGEHYGQPTNAPWGIRYTHPDAEVPSTAFAYQSGALYEVLLALLILAVIWPIRARFKRPGMLLCAVVALYAMGRFVIFFVIRDAEIVALGLRQAQWTSIALMALAAAAATALRRFTTISPESQ